MVHTVHVQLQGTTRRDSKLTKEEFIDQNVKTVFLLLEEVKIVVKNFKVMLMYVI